MTDESKHSTTTIYFLIGAGIAIAIFLGFVLFGFKQPEPVETKIEYNYFTFEPVGGLWETKVKNGDQLLAVTLRFNPYDVENVTIQGELNKSFNLGDVYITFDPLSTEDQFKYLALAASELTLNLVRGLNKTAVAACTKDETEACKGRPTVTCADTNKSVILIDSNQPTQIQLDDRCVKLSGAEMELLKSVDRLLYQWYGIMR